MIPRYARRSRATLRCAPHLEHPPCDRGDANIPSPFRAVRSQNHPRNVPRRLRLESTSTTSYSRVSIATRAYADGFLAIIARHTLTDGGLAEQFDKIRGPPAKRSRSVVELLGRANSFPREGGRVRWRLGCKEFGGRLLSRQAIGVRMIIFVAS